MSTASSPITSPTSWADLTDQEQQTILAAAQIDTNIWVHVYKPRVRLPDGHDVAFEPYPYQRDLLRALDDGGPVIANKARQIGVSTCVMLQKLRRALTNQGLMIPVVSRKERLAVELLDRVRLAYHSLQEPKASLVTDRQTELQFENGSRIIAEAASEKVGRTYAASDVVFDEFAHCAWQEEMWRSVRPTVSATGNIAVISTPSGEGDLFERRWTALTGRPPLPGPDTQDWLVPSGDSNWRAFCLPWWSHPDRDDEWKERERQDYTTADWGQEFECDFLSAAEAIFGAACIDACVETGSHWLPRVMGQAVHGVDVAGQGRADSVMLTLDDSAKPYWISDIFASDSIGGVAFQQVIEQKQRETSGEVGIDFGGVGYGIAENLAVPHQRITFTGGSTVGHDGNLWRVPRDRLLSNALQVVERGDLAINPRYQELITALRTARWEKRMGSYVDYLDALLIALWLAEQRGRGGGFFLFGAGE